MIRKTIPPIMTAFQGIKQRKFKFAVTFAGIILLILITLLLTGMISFSPGIRNAVIKGNGYYSKGSYDKALKEYKKGLSEKTEDPKLNFNAGQASYSLKNYQQAVSYYDKASDTIDKYLNAGNSCYKQAEKTQDQNQKNQLLQQALELYHQGILKFPQDISLKYNYELVKSKLDELKKNNQNKNDQDKDQKDKDQQDKDKNKDQKDKYKNKDKNDQQNQNKNGDDKNQQDKQDKNDSSNQNKSKDKDKKQNQDSEQQKKDKQKQQQEGSKSDKKDNNKKTTGQESPLNQDKTKASKADKNREEVTQVLQMLEKQEENSLKNNQEVKGKGKEDRYDW